VDARRPASLPGPPAKFSLMGTCSSPSFASGLSQENLPSSVGFYKLACQTRDGLPRPQTPVNPGLLILLVDPVARSRRPSELGFRFDEAAERVTPQGRVRVRPPKLPFPPPPPDPRPATLQFSVEWSGVDIHSGVRGSILFTRWHVIPALT
jgi:hypothetical protein